MYRLLVITINIPPAITTGPKMRFPTYSAFQNMTFPGISYTFLVQDRATFHANERNV